MHVIYGNFSFSVPCMKLCASVLFACASADDYEWPNSCSICHMMTVSCPFSNIVVIFHSIAKATMLRVGSDIGHATF